MARILTPEEIKLNKAYATLSTGSTITLKKGSTGNRVKALQTAIGLPDDGNFGEGTVTALKAWQVKNGIPETGEFDFSSRIKMVNLASENTIRLALEDIDLDGFEEETAEQKVETTTNEFLTRIGAIPQNQTDQPQTSPVPGQTSAKIETANVAEGLITSNPLVKAELIQPTQLPTQTQPELSLADLLGINLTTPAQTNVTNVNSQSIANANNTFQNATTVANENSTIISEANNTLYANYQNAVNSQNAAIEKLNNVSTLVSQPTVNQIQNNTSQIQQATQTLSPMVAAMQGPMPEPAAQVATVESTVEPISRVETNEIINNETAMQIIKPANPVVTSVEMMGSQVSKSIQNLSTDLSSTVSNMKSGDQVSSSSVTNVDQSSIYNMKPGEQPSPAQPTQEATPTPETNANLNNVMLSAIYELLASGIKVKITY
jgi:hypothetical protein